MTQEKRLVEIKQMLKENHQISTRFLASYFKVSFDTARRDVLRLTTTGQAIRIHGGLMEINQNDVPDFLSRNQIQSPIKERMAKVAKRFVHPGQFDFIGPSTTLCQLCNMLGGIDLQIVTNSIDNAAALMRSPLPAVSMLGGEIRKSERLTYSAPSLDEINHLHFNTAFIGTSRVRDDGIYTATTQDAQLISAAVKNSTQTVLIAEKYKFTNTSSSPFMSASLDQIDVVISDTPLSNEIKRNFSSHTQFIPIMKKANYD